MKRFCIALIDMVTSHSNKTVAEMTAFNRAMAGNDALDACWSNDLLLGEGGDDTLNAGLGSDTLIGGYHNDTYLYNRGDGAVSIVWDAANDARRRA